MAPEPSVPISKYLKIGRVRGGVPYTDLIVWAQGPRVPPSPFLGKMGAIQEGGFEPPPPPPWEGGRHHSKSEIENPLMFSIWFNDLFNILIINF